MKQTPAVLACMGLLVAACVPAIDDPEPAGAAGYVTEPSAATRGEPFVTVDGWTLRIEELVLQASAIAEPALKREGRAYSADSDLVRWNGRDRVELVSRALAVGTWYLNVGFTDFYVYDDDVRDAIVDRGVPPALGKRLDGVPLRGDASRYIYDASARVAVLIVRGEKGGRIVRLDTSLARGSVSSGERRGTSFEVKADALVARPLAVEAERLFLGIDQRLAFEPLVSADANGDGTIARDELEAPTSELGPDGTRPETLGGLLDARLMTIIVTP